MEKYMGNKTKLLEFIFEGTENNRRKGENTFFDAFTGTTNVAKHFKAKGFNVITNDINEFSNVLSKCYVINSKIPKFPNFFRSESYSNANYSKVGKTKSFLDRSKLLLLHNKQVINAEFSKQIEKTNYLRLLTYLTYYATPADYDNESDIGYVKNRDLYEFLYNNYCAEGPNSKYINQIYQKSLINLAKELDQSEYIDMVGKIEDFINDKNLDRIKELNELGKNRDLKNVTSLCKKILQKSNVVGNRKFFSIEHAKRLDIILNTIYYWNKNELINDSEYSILLTSVIESIVIFSNTSATYQAFYKDYKANTQQSFRLVIPELILSNREEKHLSLVGDIFDSIEEVECDILYLDPPYNWRKYDSNYHLLNTVASIDKIKNLKSFEENIVGASGENRVEKIDYTSFHDKGTFLDKLFKLIVKSKCSLVVLSYSDSESNHSVGDSRDTINKLEDFFMDESIFEKNSFEKLSYEKQNFESRKNSQKQNVNELLFIARKK